MRKTGIKGNFFNLVKNTDIKSTSNTVIYNRKLNALPLNQEQGKDSTFTASVQHYTGSSEQSNHKEKIQSQKE